MNATRRDSATGRRGPATGPRRSATGTGCRLNGDVVDEIAQKFGWVTPDEIAAGLGTSKSTYYRMLAGELCPRLTTARRMARLGEVTVDRLFPDLQAAA